MGDLIGFEGYLNTSTPYDRGEHNALWKSERRYHDFTFGNDELAKCEYPRFYSADGLEVTNLTTELVGCRDSDFDQVNIPCAKIQTLTTDVHAIVWGDCGFRQLPRVATPNLEICVRSRSIARMAARCPSEDRALFLHYDRYVRH